MVTSHLKFLLLLVTNFSHQCSTYTQTLLMKIKNRNKNHTSGFYPTFSSYSPSPLLSHDSRKVCMDILSLCPYFPFIYPGCFSLPSLQVLPRSPLILSHLLGPFGIIWRWWPLSPSSTPLPLASVTSCPPGFPPKFPSVSLASSLPPSENESSSLTWSRLCSPSTFLFGQQHPYLWL